MMDRPKIVAIIQARMGSTRLPGKVLKDIIGRPMLWHVVTRVRQAKQLDQVIVATTDGPSDDLVATFCEQEGTPCFRGSEEDVLDRYYQAAQSISADVVVRITADCPLIDPEVLDTVISTYVDGQCDYASNTIECTYPDGLDTEVFSFKVLEKTWREARLMSEREHVTPYIWKNRDAFKLCKVTHEEDWSDLRWTVDEPEDLEFVRSVYKRLYHPSRVFLMEDVLRLLAENRTLLDKNQGFIRNEGYLRSLREDRVVSSQ